MKAHFQCSNCGNRVEKNLMPSKHAMRGAIPSINYNISCCEEPDYQEARAHTAEEVYPRLSSR